MSNVFILSKKGIKNVINVLQYKNVLMVNR